MTTVESLLCEVNPLLEARLALKCGEELFFGESLLLEHHTNEAPSASESHNREHHNKGKKEKGHHSKGDHEPSKHDSLQNAIANAKETVRKALQEAGTLSTCAGLPQTIIDEITQLKKENESMRKEMNELRSLLKDIEKRIMVYVY
uniref:Elongation factor 1-delta n=1 Tax=Parascaris univalens TaxID=6257 RepID=A0A914ZQ51_PARUN